MSQISSSSGVRVAAQPLSNVYTVLLLIGALALVLTALALCVTMNSRYGVILGVSEEGRANKEAPEAAARRQQGIKAELQKAQDALKAFPEGVGAPGLAPPPAEPPPAEPPAATPPAAEPPAATPPAAEPPAATPPAAEPPAATPPAAEPAPAPAAN